jgi:hypothetical protein
MTLRDRSPKPNPTGTTSTADNKPTKAGKPSKTAKTAKNNKADKVTKNTNTDAASKNKANKPKKIIARYIFGPKALQTLQLYKKKSNAQFVDGYLERSGKEQKAGIEITVAVSEEFQFLKWTKGMMFRDLKFAKEMGMEMDEGEFRKRWDNEE